MEWRLHLWIGRVSENFLFNLWNDSDLMWMESTM
jgi:hypothetical protein